MNLKRDPFAVDPEGRGSWEELEGVGGRENHHQKSEEEIIIQTHCMKKNPIFNKRKERKGGILL